MPDDITYDRRIVAFIDILGFRELVAKLKTDSTLHRKLHRALAEIKSYERTAGDAHTAQADIEASVFSDSIVISAAPEHLFTVIWSSIVLQARLIAQGVLARGGISHGQTFHKDGVIYGEGMIKAYDLESRTAIYPRIVIEPELAKEISPTHKAMLLSQDVDGLWYTDPFAFGVLPGGADELAADGYDPHLVFLESFATRIAQEITDAKDVGVAAKWNWLQSKHREALAYHQKHKKTRMWRVTELAKQQSKTT